MSPDTNNCTCIKSELSDYQTIIISLFSKIVRTSKPSPAHHFHDHKTKFRKSLSFQEPISEQREVRVQDAADPVAPEGVPEPEKDKGTPTQSQRSAELTQAQHLATQVLAAAQQIAHHRARQQPQSPQHLQSLQPRVLPDSAGHVRQSAARQPAVSEGAVQRADEPAKPRPEKNQ